MLHLNGHKRLDDMVVNGWDPYRDFIDEGYKSAGAADTAQSGDAYAFNTNLNLKVIQIASGFFDMASQGPTTQPWRKRRRKMGDF